MSSQVVDALLREISGALYRRDSAFLNSALPLGGDLLSQPPYTVLVAELNATFPSSIHDPQDEKLEKHCVKLLPVNEDCEPDGPTGTAWPAFVIFIKEYFIYLRDRDYDLVELHERMVNLLTHCITALTHSSLGIVVLELCLEYAQVLKVLSLTFEVTEEVKQQTYNTRLSLKREGKHSYPTMQKPAERVAETLQKALNVCLADRSGGGGPGNRFARPTGKRVAIYKFSIIMAKCMAGSGNLSGLASLFSNIQKLGPPLEFYPASQRVTYLYYLGRYHSRFDNFYRAVQCLESAYMQCPRQFIRQRRQILKFLLADSIVLGRFPSQELFSRPEAEGFEKIFLPVCYAVRQGDFKALRTFVGEVGGEAETAISSGQAAYAQAWLRKFGILYKLQSHLRLSTWRCLVRKAFIIGGFHGDGKKPPMVDFDVVVSAAEFVDPTLIWPGGRQPWYQNIGNRDEWLKQRTEEWTANITKHWELDPEQNVARWPWEPGYDDFPQRLRRSVPSGGDNPEVNRPPLNDAEYDEWTVQEQHRHRTLRRYLAKMQQYRQDAGEPNDPAADSKWLEDHCMPVSSNEIEMMRWWTRHVDPYLSEKADRGLLHNLDGDLGDLNDNAKASHPFQAPRIDFGGMSRFGKDTDQLQNSTISCQVASADLMRRSSSPLFLRDYDPVDNVESEDQTRFTHGHTAVSDDSDSWSTASASSFDSDEAAEAAWSGGTFLLSRPKPFPERIPRRDYPPSPPERPPSPLNTDSLVINELSNLVSNGLINGFVSWNMRAFAIEGAKKVGALEAGFPRVWDVMVGRSRAGDQKAGVKPGWVPAWIREEYEPTSSAGGGVVTLGSARPAGG
ncbi:MAG: hypothetical protein M1814_005278 [Vezdaea aestivalis]|nr:MAG: hypothetical protein M1814_005278 [Vezdaea aestivalis]